MENVTLHLLLGLLTPFVIFLIAEALHVSGILAIFAAGIAHSFNRDKFNPEKASLSIASESVWSMLTFTLEGLVFVILGTQLPKILSSINQNTYSITSLQIIAYILLITFLFFLLRFVWSVVVVKKKTYHDAEQPVNRFRAGVIFSLSGARGAVTLACVMSIPVFLSDGTAFPERDLMILIAGGVIVLSLLITSFILPLCVEKNVKIDRNYENQAYLEILQNVITELRKRISPENESATAIVVSNYLSRSAELQRKQSARPVDREEERSMRITVYEWEKARVAELLALGEIKNPIAQFYLSILDRQMKKLSKSRLAFGKNMLRFFHHTYRAKRNKAHDELRADVFALITMVSGFILEKLRTTSQTDDSPVIRKIIMEYEFRLSMHQRGLRYNNPDKDTLATVVSHAFQTERDNISTMHETGRISRETAKEMRHNISLLEVQLKKEYF